MNIFLRVLTCSQCGKKKKKSPRIDIECKYSVITEDVFPYSIIGMHITRKCAPQNSQSNQWLTCTLKGKCTQFSTKRSINTSLNKNKPVAVTTRRTGRATGYPSPSATLTSLHTTAHTRTHTACLNSSVFHDKQMVLNTVGTPPKGPEGKMRRSDDPLNSCQWRVKNSRYRKLAFSQKSNR